MKQFCRSCGKSFRNRQRRMECPNCDIRRYNKLKNKTMLNQIAAPELEEESVEEENTDSEDEEE